MTPEEALEGATDLLLSKDYEPILMQALTNAKDVPTGAAVVVAPILLRMIQDGEIPIEEVLGTEEGDGIAIYLLVEVFEIAAGAGLIPGGDVEEGEGPESAEEPGEVEADPAMRQMAEQAVDVLRSLLDKGGAFGQPQGMPAGGPPQAPAGAPPAPAPTDPAQGGGLMRGGAP